MMKKTVFGVSLKVLAFSTWGIVLCIMIPAFYFMDSLYYEVNHRNLSETAESVLLLSGDDVSDFFENTEHDNANPEWFDSFSKKTPFRITLIYRDGTVMADSYMNPRSMVNHLGRPEVDDALLGQKGKARRQSLSAGEEQIYLALPVWSGGDAPIGVFRLSRSIPSFTQRISSSAAPFLVLVLVVTAAAFGAVYLFSRSLSRAFDRLVAITHAGETAAKVNFSAEAPFISDTEEFVKVETAMRDMAKELRSHIEQAVIEGRRLEAILNGMSEAVFAADPSLKLILINQHARNLFGIVDTGDGQQSGVPTLLEATGSAELEEAAQKVLSGAFDPPAAPLEFGMKRHRGGKQMAFHVFAAPFGITPGAAPSGALGGVVIVLNDITRLQKLEQVRKDFAANVSHELRTPIQVVKGFSETILDSLNPETGKDIPLPNEQLVHCVEMIAKNARTMENLTHDLLTLVSLEDEQGERPEMENVNVESLMQEAVQSVGIQQRKKNITIHQSCSPELAVKLHGPFIIQALTNLLDNAIKYSSPRAGIWFTADTRPAADSPEEGKQELVFTVKDEGIGIPAEHLGRLFERFYRVDKARSREAGGTGLGLSIVRHIALIHHGSAEVLSHAGEGSTFTLRLPVE